MRGARYFGIERNTILQNIDEITKFAQSARKEDSANASICGLFGKLRFYRCAKGPAIKTS
jgi:hypothetical protein